MPINSTEAIAKSFGDFYLAPLATGDPTIEQLADPAALETAGWGDVGAVHEDGPELSGFEGETTLINIWNRIAAFKSVTEVTERAIALPLVQWNVANLQLYFPGSTYDAGSKKLTIPEAGTPTDYEGLLVVAEGDRYYGLWLGRVNGRPGGSLTFPDGGEDLSILPVTFDILTTGDPTKVAVWIGSEPAAAESS